MSAHSSSLRSPGRRTGADTERRRVCSLDRIQLAGNAAGAVYDEAWLQRLIHRVPACLPIAEIELALALDELIAVCAVLPTDTPVEIWFQDEARIGQ